MSTPGPATDETTDETTGGTGAEIVGDSTAENTGAFQPPPPPFGLLPPQRVRWGLPDAAIGIGIFLVILGATVLIARAVPNLDGNVANFVFAIVAYGALIGLLVFSSVRRGLGGWAADYGFEFRWIDVLLGIGIAVAGRIATVLIYAVAIGLGLPQVPVSNIQLGDSLVWNFLNGIVIASLLAPIVEEVFTRGMLMRAIRNRVIRTSKGDPAKIARAAGTISILLSSGVFMALHLHEARSLTQLVVLVGFTLSFGLLTAWIATRTGRLGPSIIAHILTNASGVILLLATRPH